MNHHILLWYRHQLLVEGPHILREQIWMDRLSELCTVYTVHNPNFFKVWMDNEQDQ